MERFTFRTVGGTAVLYLGDSSEWAIISGRNNHEYKISGDAAERLAAYEDTGLEPEDVRRLQGDWTSLIMALDEMGGMPHLHDLLQAEQDGRLEVLPCKVGDTIYYTREGYPIVEPLKVRTFFVGDTTRRGEILHLHMIRTDKFDVSIDALGKTVFLTREEAETAMALKGGEV